MISSMKKKGLSVRKKQYVYTYYARKDKKAVVYDCSTITLDREQASKSIRVVSISYKLLLSKSIYCRAGYHWR